MNLPRRPPRDVISPVGRVSLACVHGRVVSVIAEADYGFIETSDGREIYFHRNSVVDGSFDRLEVGREVRLVVADDESEKGPQASTVKPIGKHHLVE